jgi:hypothetical protein
MANKVFLVLVMSLVFFGMVSATNAYPINKEKKVVKSHYRSWGYNPDYSLRCNRIAWKLIGGDTPSTMPMTNKADKMMSEGCFKPTL